MEKISPSETEKHKVSYTRGDSGKPDEHERHVEDVDKKGKEEQLAQESTTSCCRFVREDLRAGPVEQGVVAEVEVEESRVKGPGSLLKEEEQSKSRNEPAVAKATSSKSSKARNQVQLLALLPLGQDVLKAEGSVGGS